MRSKDKTKPSPCSHLPQTALATGVAGDDGLPATNDGSAKTTSPAQHVEECEVCKMEKKAARTYRTKIILGLVLPFTLQSFDMTIIASALPWIAAQFGEIVQLNWVVAAFNLTAAAFIPSWGQMADIFGRYWCLQAAVVIMLIGSVLCTAAPTYAFPVLLLGRGLQGVGAAGIGVVVEVVLADKVSLKENAKNNSIFSFVAGISFGIEPVLGGVLTKANWRWCFGINLPVCVLSIIALGFIRSILLGPQPTPQLLEAVADSRPTPIARLKMIDVGGQFLVLFGFGLMILALTWAGATYDWNTVAVLVPLIIGVLLVLGFIVWQYLMAPGRLLSRVFPFQKPMLPWELLRQRNIGLLFYINLATGMGMYSVLYFVSLYFTMVKGHDSRLAGVQLLFYTPGIGTGVILSMFMCNSWPRQTWWPILLGSIVESVALAALSYALYDDNKAAVFGMMALAGAGTGMRLMPGTIHAIGFFPAHISTIVAFMGVAFPFGGTLALTIMATVFNNVSNIGRDSPYRESLDFSHIPQDALHRIRQDVKMGIVWAFVAIIPFMVICIIAALALGNVQITTDELHSRDEAYKANLTEGSYLYVVLGRKGKQKSATEGHDAPP